MPSSFSCYHSHMNISRGKPVRNKFTKSFEFNFVLILFPATACWFVASLSWLICFVSLYVTFVLVQSCVYILFMHVLDKISKCIIFPWTWHIDIMIWGSKVFKNIYFCCYITLLRSSASLYLWYVLWISMAGWWTFLSSFNRKKG